MCHGESRKSKREEKSPEPTVVIDLPMLRDRAGLAYYCSVFQSSPKPYNCAKQMFKMLDQPNCIELRESKTFRFKSQIFS